MTEACDGSVPFAMEAAGVRGSRPAAMSFAAVSPSAGRDGNPGVGRHSHGRTHPRDDRKRDARGAEGQRFFAATPEDERVAAFQADDALALARLRDEDGVNFVLGHGVGARAFAGVNALRAGRGEVQEPG